MLKEVSGHTKMMGTVGHPIVHSLSPLIHTALGIKYNKDLVYLAYDITADKAGDFAQAMRTLGILGVNITMPNKQAIIPFLDEVDGMAARCGAVNLVKNVNGHLTGYNVDAAGFMIGLEQNGISVTGKRVLLLGAGGAARSLVEEMLDHKVGSICILNRTPEKAEELCAGREAFSFGPMEPERMAQEAAAADLIVNTTSLGMAGTGADYTDFAFLDRAHCPVVEVVYYPLKTTLLLEAEKRGLPIVKGLDMLIYQALLTFEIVNDVKCDFAADYAFVEKLLLDEFDRQEREKAAVR
ncbi:MAG: shikimate dehydrogenase [Lachnospiraceae bacterium]|nr:shikimate dehydrogenase [Lachnospiraceae bacterium]